MTPSVALSGHLREFVSRDEQIQIFKAMLNGVSRNRILILAGDSGLGKTWLIDRLVHECEVQSVMWRSLTFNKETGAPSYVDILWSTCNLIGSSHFSQFEQALDEYQSPTYRLELETSGHMPTIVVGSDSELHRPVFGDIAGISVSNPRFHSASPDLAALPIQEELTDLFVRGLTGSCDGNCFVWFFDDCDYASDRTKFWLWEVLLPSVTRCAQNLIVVMTRNNSESLDRRWRYVAEVQMLHPFSVEEIRSYLTARGLSETNRDLVNMSFAATEGHPRTLGKLVDAYLDVSASRKRDEKEI